MPGGRRVAILTTIALLLGLPLPEALAGVKDDHLIPVEPSWEQGELGKYKTLYERKLFVTPGEVARFLYLPSGTGTERLASVYLVPHKRDSLPGDYWVTTTEASAKLWNCIPLPGEKQHPQDARTIRIRRSDAPLPETTGRVIHELWMAMLVHSRSPSNDLLVVDSAILIFSAADPAGVVLRARANSVEGSSADLWALGESLIEYAQLPVAKRSDYAREIEKAANRLLTRLRGGVR